MAPALSAGSFDACLTLRLSMQDTLPFVASVHGVASFRRINLFAAWKSVIRFYKLIHKIPVHVSMKTQGARDADT